MSAASYSENRLLAALPVEDYVAFAPHLEAVSLSTKQVLLRPDEDPQHVYFPTSCVVSLLTGLNDGTVMDVGLVGREGIVGISVLLGGSKMNTATVQGQGAAIKLRIEKLREEFNKGGALQSALLRYTQAAMMQLSQLVVCNARHTLEERLACWLLTYGDRVGSDEFELSREFMADMLGVGLFGVGEVTEKLRGLGLIQYQRDHLAIPNREALEQFACACYPVVKEQFDNLLL